MRLFKKKVKAGSDSEIIEVEDSELVQEPNRVHSGVIEEGEDAEPEEG